jgi:hypothetical protein
MSVATNTPFQGLEVQPGRAVYIAAEGTSGLAKRAAAWEFDKGIEAGEKLIVLDTPLQIADSSTRAAFIEAVADLSPALIVLDTLARCAVGLDENNTRDMSVFADALGDLARSTGAHVLTVHHNNKMGEFRGSSALPAAVDTHLSLERLDTDLIKLTIEKQKDDEECAPMRLQARPAPVPGGRGEVHSLVFYKLNDTSTKDDANDKDRTALAALEAIVGEAGATSSAWKEAAEPRGIKGGSFYESQKRLLDLGLVCVVSGEHGRRGALFAPKAPKRSGGVSEQFGMTLDFTPKNDSSFRSIVSEQSGAGKNGVKVEDENKERSDEDFEA